METKINPTGVEHIHSCWPAQLMFYVYLDSLASLIIDFLPSFQSVSPLSFIVVDCVRLVVGVEPNCSFNQLISETGACATALSLTTFSECLIEAKSTQCVSQLKNLKQN